MSPKRSLTWVLFLLLTAGCFLVIGANGMSATYLIEVDVQRRIQREMREGIAACASFIAQKVPFLTCYRTFNAAETSRVLSDAFVFCGVDGQAPDPTSLAACQAVDGRQVNWIPAKDQEDYFSGFYKENVWSREWTAWRLSAEPS